MIDCHLNKLAEMSCKLIKLSYVSDLNNIKRILLRSSSANTNKEREESGFSLWNDIGQKEDKKDDDTWINDCQVALSPALDVMVFALKNTAVFLTSKWFASEDSDVKLKFSMTFGDSFICENADEITSLLCLPIASQKRSLQGNADWTCVIVGFASGFIKMYTERAELLLSQHLHNGRITKIKCHTYSALRSHFLSDNQAEELLIIYNSAVVSVDGFSLFQTLRACRNQLARAAAGNWETVEAPPLTYKKWSFQENDKVVDCESIGTITTQPFDSLAAHSLRSGFYSSARSRSSVANLYVTVGSVPYIGFYHATEGSSELLLSDVAHAVASRLKTFFKNTAAGGLLGWNNQTDKIEPPTTIPLRYGLFDRTRYGISISTSPNKLLAVVTDTFGRVVMYDIQKGIAIRVWKGYRDAQCGWLQVEEENDKNTQKQDPKRAAFLIIYAPRRGILEVWASQQGPRVAAFNVGKSCKLLNPGHTMMGLNMIIASNVKIHMYPCLLVDADGGVFTISIPFHCALSDKNSKSARDMHLLKEFKSMLRSSTKGNSEFVGDITKLLLDIKTANVRQQALDSLLICSSITVDAMNDVISKLFEHLKNQNLEQLDYESKLLLQTCCRIEKLISTYSAICNLNKNSLPDCNEDKIADIELVSEKLNITETEVGRILSLVMLFHSVNTSRQKRVRFVDVDKGTFEMTFSSFVRSFIVNENHLIKIGDDIATSQLIVNMNTAASQEQLASTGEFIFAFCIQCNKFLPVLDEIIAESQIAIHSLIVILLHYWLASEDISNKSKDWVNFQLLLKHICTCEISHSSEGELSHTLPLDNIRLLLSQSMNNTAAYLGAIVTRSVCIEMVPSFRVEAKQCNANDNECNEEEVSNDKSEEKEASDESEWETISLDVEQWSLLVKQLEDVLILSILLKCRPSNKIQLPSKKCNISLACLQSGGPGIMTDLVAAWCVDAGIGPEVLNTYSDDNDIYACIPDQVEHAGVSDDKIKNFSLIKGLLGQIQKRFPRSMDPDALLANCSWEHMVHWDKNHDIVRHLRSAIQCLSLVVSAILRSGVACMMWKTFIHKRFEALALLIEKVGKTPKDRLCRRDVEMSDAYLAHFVDFCCQLLEILLESNVISEVESIPMFPAEETWQRNDIQGPAPFVTLALKQQNPNYALIHHHLLLANSLLFIIVFDQKNIHPLSLYDTRGKSALFKELHCNVVIPIKGLDTELIALRKQFLLSVTTAVVRNISSINENEIHNVVVCTTMGDIEANKWFNRILDLARGWDINLDDVRRHYICELYNCGHDTFAEEARASVTDNVILASQLLLLVGQRVQYVLSDAEQSVVKLARLSPSLSTWLKTLSKPYCCSVPLSVTAVLLSYVMNFLPENQMEYQLALLLLEAINDLIDMQTAK